MLNLLWHRRYARVAELGKGVHGKVWLCEDTDTGEFFAIKSVNREDRRNRSLKREQAEAQAKARAQALEDEAELREEEERQRRKQRERANNPNASFDEEMQLNESFDVDEHSDSKAIANKELARQKSAIRKTMMDEKVKQEIAIMKRIHHPNVVQLREVIDDIRSKKIFMGKRLLYTYPKAIADGVTLRQFWNTCLEAKLSGPAMTNRS